MIYIWSIFFNISTKWDLFLDFDGTKHIHIHPDLGILGMMEVWNPNLDLDMSLNFDIAIF